MSYIIHRALYFGLVFLVFQPLGCAQDGQTVTLAASTTAMIERSVTIDAPFCTIWALHDDRVKQGMVARVSPKHGNSGPLILRVYANYNGSLSVVACNTDISLGRILVFKDSIDAEILISGDWITIPGSRLCEPAQYFICEEPRK